MSMEFTLASIFAGITAVHVFLAVAGQIIHILARVLKVVRSKKKLIWKKWAVENVLQTVLAFACIAVLMIIMKDDMGNYLAFTIGYAVDSIMKQVLAKGGSEYPTPLQAANLSDEEIDQ